MSCLESRYIPYQPEDWMGQGPALFFAPHPDDEVFGCAGALLKHVASGDPVRVIIVTTGAFGVEGCDYALIRQQESRRAAEILGYGEPIFWGYPDRGLEVDEPLIQRIVTEMEGYNPQIVYAPSWWEIHPDHTALSWAVVRAAQETACRRELCFYEVGVPLPVNRLLDITDLADRKRQAMAVFKSQLVTQAYDRQVMALNQFRSYTLGPGVDFAEAYRSVEVGQIPTVSAFHSQTIERTSVSIGLTDLSG